jgi:hypothetical protein
MRIEKPYDFERIENCDTAIDSNNNLFINSISYALNADVGYFVNRLYV